MRKLFGVFCLLVVASMLLSACGAKATEVPAVTQAPATELQLPNLPRRLTHTLGQVSWMAMAFPMISFRMFTSAGRSPMRLTGLPMRSDLYNTEAVQSFELPLIGMPGYDPNAPHFVYDLAQSEAEFKLADLDHDGIVAGDETDGSDVWNMGFRIQMLFNQGNTVRQTVTEILAAKLYKVNPLFLVDTLGLPWPAYLAAQRAGQIPILTAGWQEDIHDPHNWYQPYTTGSYGSRQHLPADLSAQIKDLLNRGVAATDPAARSAIYYQLNQLYYDQAIGFPLVTATSHNFEQRWVQGRIINPIYPGINFSTISKAEGAPNPTTFTRASIGDIIDLDPALAYDTPSGEILQNVYQTLVYL